MLNYLMLFQVVKSQIFRRAKGPPWNTRASWPTAALAGTIESPMWGAPGFCWSRRWKTSRQSPLTLKNIYSVCDQNSEVESFPKTAEFRFGEFRLRRLSWRIASWWAWRMRWLPWHLGCADQMLNKNIPWWQKSQLTLELSTIFQLSLQTQTWKIWHLRINKITGRFYLRKVWNDSLMHGLMTWPWPSRGSKMFKSKAWWFDMFF